MMLNVLQNEATQLNNICIEHIQDYCEALYKAKSNKTQAALNRVSYEMIMKKYIRDRNEFKNI